MAAFAATDYGRRDRRSAGPTAVFRRRMRRRDGGGGRRAGGGGRGTAVRRRRDGRAGDSGEQIVGGSLRASARSRQHSTWVAVGRSTARQRVDTSKAQRGSRRDGSGCECAAHSLVQVGAAASARLGGPASTRTGGRRRGRAKRRRHMRMRRIGGTDDRTIDDAGYQAEPRHYGDVGFHAAMSRGVCWVGERPSPSSRRAGPADPGRRRFATRRCRVSTADGLLRARRRLACDLGGGGGDASQRGGGPTGASSTQ
jgi:hypothetical protein